MYNFCMAITKLPEAFNVKWPYILRQEKVTKGSYILGRREYRFRDC